MNKIYLHKEHGVNPTISQCIMCGKDKNEIALLGAAYKEKAPMHMVTSIEPCEDCKNQYLSKGVLLFESLDGKTPTGSFAVIKDEAFQKMFSMEIPKHKICFVDSEIIKFIQGYRKSKLN